MTTSTADPYVQWLDAATGMEAERAPGHPGRWILAALAVVVLSTLALGF